MQLREAVTITDENFTFKELWNDQHPLMHVWFLMSTISIFFITAVFWITP